MDRSADGPASSLSPPFSRMLERALRLAARGHYHQFRKRSPGTATCWSTGEPLPSSCVPYITHPVATMCILARLGAEERVLAAAVLHDYLEDVPDPDGPRTIERAVGVEVLDLVLEVTENKRPSEESCSTWEVRKQEQIASIQEMSHGAALIKAADLLHNLLSLAADLEQVVDHHKVWQRFNAAPERQLWYFETAQKALNQRLGTHPLVDELGRTIGEIQAHLRQY